MPDLSDPRRTQFQHRANATSQLFEALKESGCSRSDIRLALEQSRYAPFLSEVQRWIRSAADTQLASTPKPIPFDIRHRAFAKEAFQLLAHELRIPHHLFEQGKIEPIFLPRAGFAMRVHAEGQRWTFLTALSNGTLLTAPSPHSQELARGLASQNRQLVNILELQAPAHLEKAITPRPVTEAGSKRIALFLRNEEATPSSYIYLPPSIQESHLVPQIDWEALCNGQKRILLFSADKKKLIATVTVPAGPNPLPSVSFAKEVGESPFKRFKPLGAFLAGKTSAVPAAVEIELYRTRKTAGYTQQRILLGKQMSVPAWYPLSTIAVQPGIGPDGTRFLGLYPPGVSPTTNPPLRAFTLEKSRVHLKPVHVEAVWPGLKERADQLRALIKNVATGNANVSREAWLSLHEVAQAEPLLVSALLIGQESPFSIHDEKALQEIPGWEILKGSIEGYLLHKQARSVPYVARLLAQADGGTTPESIASTSLLSDVSYAKAKDPLTQLTRLATVAPDALEESIKCLRTSHVAAVKNLAGTGTVNQLLQRLAISQRDRA